MKDKFTSSSTEDATNRLRTNSSNPIKHMMTNADESGDGNTDSTEDELAPEVREEIAALLAQALPFDEDDLKEWSADQLRYLLSVTEAEDLVDGAGDNGGDGGDADADRQNAVSDGDPSGYGNDMFTDGGQGEQRTNAAPDEGTLSPNVDGQGRTLAEWEAEQPEAGSAERRAEKAKRKRENRANRRQQNRNRTNYAGVAGEFDRDVEAAAGDRDDHADDLPPAGTMSAYNARTNATDADADAADVDESDDDDDDLPGAGTMSDYEDVTPSWQSGRSEGAEQRLNAARRASQQQD